MINGPTLDPLTRLAIHHGCNKFGLQFYTPFYHQLFNHLRDKPICLLELGIGGYEIAGSGGFSLGMWADYFSTGNIVGVDIARKDLNLDPRVTVVHGSQTDLALLAAVAAQHGPFDIIIDDGSHRASDVVTSFWALFPSLADGGFYVIEDVQCAFSPAFGGSPVDGGETLGLAQQILQALHHQEIPHSAPDWQPPPIASMVRSFQARHNLFVIEKGDNTEPSPLACDPTDPHFAGALAAIARELDASPTANGCALLGTLWGMAGVPLVGLEILKGALGRWPDHVHLLACTARLAGPAGDPDLQRKCVERAVALDPTAVALRGLPGQPDHGNS